MRALLSASASFLIAALAVAGCASDVGSGDEDSSEAALSTPLYPPSPVFHGVTWDFAHQVTLAKGSDLWPLTWGADDNVWGGWGDGGGFGGDNAVDRASVGFAKISGSPPNITGVNVW